MIKLIEVSEHGEIYYEVIKITFLMMKNAQRISHQINKGKIVFTVKSYYVKINLIKLEEKTLVTMIMLGLKVYDDSPPFHVSIYYNLYLCIT